MLPSIINTSQGSVIYKNNFESDINLIYELINQVNSSKLTYFYESLLSFGVRFTGTPNCTKAGDWIYKEFSEMELITEYQHWEIHDFKSRNIIAKIPGNDPFNDAIFVISAHYDTFRDSPGANDDGSGVVSILAIADILSQYSFNHSIYFIAFSGEEVGAYGSYFYAKDAYRIQENIVAVLNLDIIGYAETPLGGSILRFFHEEPSTWISTFAQNIAKKYEEQINISIESLPNYPGADHQAFVDYGYDGVWIAQSDPNRVGHSPNDTFEHINLTYHVKTTKVMLAILVEIAMKPIPIQVILRNPLEAKGYIQDKPVIDLLFPDNFYQRLRAMTIIVGRATAKVDVFSKNPVKYVVFSINDVFTFWDTEPPYEWKIQGKFYPLFGRHKLKIFAYDENGAFDTDEMEIIIFTLSYQYGKF
jgi:hypothetical protein